MAFTYDITSPNIFNVRLLVGDTDSSAPVFTDDEVNAALTAESSQNIIVGLSGFNVYVPQVYSYRRAAAWLLNALASNRARLGSIIQLLDVKLAPATAARTLMDHAQSLIDQEANAGYFAVAEVVVNAFSMRERLNAMALRTLA